MVLPSHPMPSSTAENRMRPFALEQRGRLIQDNTESYPADDFDREAMSTLDLLWSPLDTVKYGLEAQWLLNLAFNVGYQHHVYSGDHKGLVFRGGRGKGRVREVRNKCRSYSERRAADYLSFTPHFMGRPRTSDIEDQQSSRLAAKVSDHYWSMEDMADNYETMTHWMVKTGNGFLKVLWDSTVGQSVEDEETGQLLFEGDVHTEAVSPFQMYTDPLTVQPKDCEWMIQVTNRTLDWVDRHYPDKAPYVAADDSFDEKRYHERYILNLVGPGGYHSGLDSITPNHSYVTVKELWMRANPSYPRGRLVIEANGVILRNTDNPTPDYQLPYIWFRDMLVDGRAWGQSFLDNFISPQRNYNRLKSKKLEHVFRTANAKVIWPGTTKVPDTSFSTEIGEVINYTGQVPPSYLEPPQMPKDVDDEAMAITRDLDDISSSFGPSRGQYQGKLSGDAIQLLIEQDQSIKKPALRRHARGLQKWARLVCATLQQNLGPEDERFLRIAGKGEQFDVIGFKQADFRNNYDVLIEADSVQPKSKTMAMRMVQYLGQTGLINPAAGQDRARAWKMLDMEDDDVVIDDERQHRRMAQQENKMMSMGMPAPPPQYYEDLDTHTLVHTQFMISDEYKLLPQQIQALFHIHLDATYKLAYPEPGVMGFETQPIPQESQESSS